MVMVVLVMHFELACALAGHPGSHDDDFDPPSSR